MRQSEINDLINQFKRLILDNNMITIPKSNEYIKLDAKSSTKYFYVDINRKGNRIKRFTLQLRNQEKKELPLLRFDLVGPPHPNPPGDFPFAEKVIPCPHLHIAHEEYGDKIAYPLTYELVQMRLTPEELSDFVKILKSFLKRCNIEGIESYNYSYQEEMGF
ncbi:hypothetical protein MTP04_08330 [Lysinibacillus sp. PLM2]|nr:hypothetical protein MTP04_08330 [Lysinibacillus sp. PLM2]